MLDLTTRPNDIRVIGYPRMGTDERVVGCVPEGLTIDEIVGEMVVSSKIHPGAIRSLRVSVLNKDGFETPIPYDAWMRVRPRNGAQVMVRSVPMGGGGGGGGGKNPIIMVAMIVVMVVACIVAPYLAPAFVALSGGLLTTAMATTLAMAAVTMVGNLMINALVGPPSFSGNNNNQAGASGGASPISGPAFSITGVSNRGNPYGPVPRVYGVRQMFPVLCARVYHEVVGSDEYTRALFCFGAGTIFSDKFRIGNTPFGAFSNIEYETTTGGSGDHPLTLFPKAVREEPLNVLCLHNVGNVRFATPPCDQFTVEFTFPRGLTTFDTSGGRGNCSVQMKIEYMATSVGVWTGLPCPLYTDNSTSAVRRAETFGVNSALGEIQVRCTRVTEDATDDKICDAVTWTALRSITLEAPVKRSGLALLAMRIRATDQLSGNLDQVSAVATGECIGYDRAGNYVNMVPGNPAWAFVDVLLGASNMNPVPRDQIDWPTIYDWAVDCDTWTNGAAKWSYNAIHDSRATVDSALRIIAATGRARYVFRDGKYTVVRDIPQTVPFQAFTPRNSWGWKSTRTFVKLPHALRCRWINPDLDWQEDELVVYMDGYNKNTATLFEQMDMMACTNKNQVFREARYHMAVAILRPVIYELQTDVEHIACKTGDLVQVAYDVPMWGINQARVDSVIYNSYGQVTGITVDTPLTTNAGKTYSIRIRYNDNTQAVHGVQENGDASEVFTLTYTYPSTYIVHPGDLVMFGETGHESVQLIVTNIKRGDNMSATLALVDAAPGVHTADLAIPAFDDQISFSKPVEFQPPASPSLLHVFDRVELLNSILSTRVYFVFANVPTALVKTEEFQGQYRALPDGQWHPAQTAAPNASMIFDSLCDLTPYEFRFRTLSNYGRASEWLTTQYIPTGMSGPMSTPTGFRGVVQDMVLTLAWDLAPELWNNNWRLRYSPLISGAVWENSADIGNGIPNNTPTATAFPMVGTYLLKAVNRAGMSSPTPAAYVNTVSSTKGLVLVYTVQEDAFFPGTKTNCNATGGLLEITPATDGSLPQAIYEFHAPIDHGAKFTFRLTASLIATGLLLGGTNNTDVWSSFDAVTSFDGTQNSGWTASIEVATTDNDPADVGATWSAWAPMVVSDYVARGAKARLIMTSLETSITPTVSALKLTSHLPDRTIGVQGIACPSTGFAVIYPSNFHGLPAVVITQAAAATGDYYAITSEAVSGFVITFYNASGTAKAATFSFVAHGVGTAF